MRAVLTVLFQVKYFLIHRSLVPSSASGDVPHYKSDCGFTSKKTKALEWVSPSLTLTCTFQAVPFESEAAALEEKHLASCHEESSCEWSIYERKLPSQQLH